MTFTKGVCITLAVFVALCLVITILYTVTRTLSGIPLEGILSGLVLMLFLGMGLGFTLTFLKEEE